MVESLKDHTKHKSDGQGKLKSVLNRKEDKIKTLSYYFQIFLQSISPYTINP